jgi:hypothetical protein
MKKTLGYFNAAVILGLFAVSPVSGSTGNSASPVLMMDSSGARAMALSDAFSGIADDINAVGVNPAGLAGLGEAELSAMYMNYPQGMTFGQFAAGLPAGRVGFAAVSVGYFLLPKFGRLDRLGDTSGEDLSASDLSVGASLGKRLIDKVLSFDAGIGVKYISSSLAGTGRSAFAADAGILARIKAPVIGDSDGRNLGIGLSVQNFGTGLKFGTDPTPLPMNIRAGGGYGFLRSKKADLTLDVEGNLPNDGPFSISAGLECVLAGKFALRGGYQILGAEARSFSAGVGFSQAFLGRTIKADVAFLPMAELGSLIAVSLGLGF